MQKKEASVLYTRLLESLTLRPELYQAQFSKKALRELLQACGFRARLSAFLANDTFNSCDVPSRCQPGLERGCAELEGEWLFLIFHALVEQLYHSG